MIFAHPGGRAPESTGPQGACCSNYGTCVRSGHPQKGAADRVSAAAVAELKALHRKGSAAGWPPVVHLEIAAWHDRHRPDDPALAHRWRRWGGFEFVPNQQNPTTAMNRAGGAL